MTKLDAQTLEELAKRHANFAKATEKGTQRRALHEETARVLSAALGQRKAVRQAPSAAVVASRDVETLLAALRALLLCPELLDRDRLKTGRPSAAMLKAVRQAEAAISSVKNEVSQVPIGHQAGTAPKSRKPKVLSPWSAPRPLPPQPEEEFEVPVPRQVRTR